MKLFCKHEWKVLCEKFIESDAERLIRLNWIAECFSPRSVKATHVVICSCNKCGKIKKFTTIS